MTFQDLMGGHAQAMKLKGYEKIQKAGEQARRDGHDYVWIDSCCIDKTSSQELSEVINTMFRYYKEAAVCYAFLFDVPAATDLSEKERIDAFKGSKWFKRGWTLQELIAPKEMLFYNADWCLLGTKAELKNHIRAVTTIPQYILEGGDLSVLSACAKMAWVAGRETTVPEDIAYCLLGIFDIHMPLIYGEGEERAFVRLQEEILRRTEDESLFLWELPAEDATTQEFWGLLAKSPSYFKVTPKTLAPCLPSAARSQPPVMTGRGLSTEMLLAPVGTHSWRSVYAALVNVQRGGVGYAVLLQRLSFRDSQFARVAPDIVLTMETGLRPDYTHLRRRFAASTERHHLDVLAERFDISCGPERFFVRQYPPSEQMWTNRMAGFILTPDHHVLGGTRILDASGRWVQESAAAGRHSGHSRYVLRLTSDELRGSKSITWFASLQVEISTSRVRYMVLIGQGGGKTALGNPIWPSHPVIASVPMVPPNEGARTHLAKFLEVNELGRADSMLRECASSRDIQGEVDGCGKSDDSFESEDWRGLVYYSVKLGDHLGKFWH